MQRDCPKLTILNLLELFAGSSPLSKDMRLSLQRPPGLIYPLDAIEFGLSTPFMYGVNSSGGLEAFDCAINYIGKCGTTLLLVYLWDRLTLLVPVFTGLFDGVCCVLVFCYMLVTAEALNLILSLLLVVGCINFLPCSTAELLPFEVSFKILLFLTTKFCVVVELDAAFLTRFC